jgi:Zn-dependent M28 family amino/carboxypeptidase
MQLFGKTQRKEELPPLTEKEVSVAKRLHEHVGILAGFIGERNIRIPQKLEQAKEYIAACLASYGYHVGFERYWAGGVEVANVVADTPGYKNGSPVVIIGAHYDTVEASPGADDNASGVAVMLEIACHMAKQHYSSNLRFVAFVNEEPPWFQTELMGSLVHAKGCLERKERIKAMICLESLGCYNDQPGSQCYPPLLRHMYPVSGDFIAIVGNVRSTWLLLRSAAAFKSVTDFPCHLLLSPPFWAAAGWSDHWAFWQIGIPAIMITDTALFRNQRYHTKEDKPDTLDYQEMSRVASGIKNIITSLL